ncbi:hypothetical protein COBT_003455, partial [Conglomerata obtusa]
KQEENAPVKNNNIKKECKLINVNRLVEDKNGEYQLKSEKSLKLKEMKKDVISKLKILQDGKKLVKNENLLLNNLSKKLAETKGQEKANLLVQQLECCASNSNLTKEKHAAYIIILNLIILFEKNFFKKFLIVIKNLTLDLNKNEDKMLKNNLEEIIFLTSNTTNEKNPQEKIEKKKNNTYDKKSKKEEINSSKNKVKINKISLTKKAIENRLKGTNAEEIQPLLCEFRVNNNSMVLNIPEVKSALIKIANFNNKNIGPIIKIPNTKNFLITLEKESFIKYVKQNKKEIPFKILPWNIETIFYNRALITICSAQFKKIPFTAWKKITKKIHYAAIENNEMELYKYTMDCGRFDNKPFTSK